MLKACKDDLICRNSASLSLLWVPLGWNLKDMWDYDTRIPRKTHVPVSDTVSDTRTPRILSDTYPVSIGNLCDFQIIKMNRILLRSLTDTCGIPWNWYSFATYKSNLCSCTTTLYKQVGSSCYVMCVLNLSLNDGFMAWTLCLEP